MIYREAIARWVSAGAQAAILGCTGIMLLICSQGSAVPLFDTTTLRAEAIATLALAETAAGMKKCPVSAHRA